MEDLNFEWLEDDNLLDYRTPDFLGFDNASANPAVEPSQAPSEPPSGEGGLPLLRLRDWKKDKQYDKNSPEYIHYDFRWKISQRENIRARQVSAGSDLDIVLTPRDYWEETFQLQLDRLLTDKDKFPGDTYTCEEANVTISITKTRGRNLAQSFKSLSIDWDIVDSHLEELGALFSLRKKMQKKITFSVELIYKEVSKEPMAAKGQKKKKGTGTDAQRAQLAKEAGVWSRVYKHWRCRAKYCKKGPHCWPDQKGNHIKLEYRHLEELAGEMVKNMKEGEKAADVNVNTEIPPHILREVLKASQKQKAGNTGDGPCKTNVSAHCGHSCAPQAAEGDSVEITGDRAQRLEEYCIFTVAQTNSGSWRSELEHVTEVAMGNYMELNYILQHPQVAADYLIGRGVKHPVAWQFVSRTHILRWWRESRKEIQNVTEPIEL